MDFPSETFSSETMDDMKVLIWIAFALLSPAIGWALSIQWSVLRIREDSENARKHAESSDLKMEQVLKVVENPEKNGFGTKELENVVRENTTAIKLLTDLISQKMD